MPSGAGCRGTSVNQPDQGRLCLIESGAGAQQDPPAGKSSDSSAVVLALEIHQHLGGLVKTLATGPTSLASAFSNSELASDICMPGVTATAVTSPDHTETTLPKRAIIYSLIPTPGAHVFASIQICKLTH